MVSPRADDIRELIVTYRYLHKYFRGYSLTKYKVTNWTVVRLGAVDKPVMQ